MSAGKRKILLVDDSEGSAHFAETALRKAGYAVRSMGSVADIEKAISSWEPHVILTDVYMPGMTGIEICCTLKSRYETAHVPVVLFAALPPEELKPLARECAADGYLSKVNGLERLPEEIDRLFESLVW